MMFALCIFALSVYTHEGLAVRKSMEHLVLSMQTLAS